MANPCTLPFLHFYGFAVSLNKLEVCHDKKFVKVYTSVLTMFKGQSMSIVIEISIPNT